MTPESPIAGFLLTRHCRDLSGQTQLTLWLTTPYGPTKVIINGERPLFFIAQQQLTQARQVLAAEQLPVDIKHSDFKDFDQHPHAICYFPTLDAFYRAQSLLKQHGIVVHEGDIRLPERFFMERFIRGSLWIAGSPQWQGDHWLVEQPKIKPSHFRPQLTALSLDIECSPRGELYSIGLYYCGPTGELTGCVLMLAEQPVAPPAHHHFAIETYASEQALLTAFGSALAAIDPDVIIGWNVVNFDFRLLFKRAERHHVKTTWGRGRSRAFWHQHQKSNVGKAVLPGRVVIDGIEALKTATYSFSSYTLEHVAQTLLGRGKLTTDAEHRVAQIEHDFHHDKRALAQYNLADCQLVWDIFSATQLLDFLCLRSQLTGHELDRSGGSVAAFTNVYLPHLHRAHYVAPNLPDEGGLASPGGYVMDSKPGLYRNVLVLDFKSLYPSIIRTFCIDPMGMIEGLLAPEHAIPGFAGAVFSREQHFLPAIIDALWQQRDEAKRHNDAPRSQAIKILMNSFYGVLGSGGCRFYDPRLASSITLRGQRIMQQTAAWISEQGWQVIYGDTDSTFVWIGNDVSPDDANQIGQQLATEINRRWRAYLQQQWQLTSQLEIEFETHYLRFFMPRIRGADAGSKKRYAGLKRHDDGTEMIFKGLENVRSDWTALARQFQAELYQQIFADQDPTTLVKHYVDGTLAGDFDELLIYRKRLRRPLDEYQKNIPPHVRAARLADEQQRQQGAPRRYQHGGWIHYLITTHGPEPVDYQHHPIERQHYIDKQLRPIAEGILPAIGLDFEQLISDQLGLF